MSPRPSRRTYAGVVLAALVGLGLVVGVVASTGASTDHRTGDAASVLSPPEPPEVEAQRLSAVPAGKQKALRAGEQRLTLEMPEEYTPSTTGAGTDDYRCFLLDPELTEDVWLTGSHVLPGNADVVHHVILFKLEEDQVEDAEALDHKTVAPGWSCFGGTGLDGGRGSLTNANWLAAWAPGGDERTVKKGFGTRLEAGSRVVMQVHYNLLQGATPDRSATQLRWMPGDTDLTALHTYLMPAPVELPCRAERADGPLCTREAARADLERRFGSAAGTADVLHLLCGEQEPGGTTTCTRRVPQEMTVHAAAGHMHLLGREIEVVANAGTPDERTILDIDLWDFDDQGAQPVEPLTVTCRHEQWLRDKLPAFEGEQEKYVMWGDGSTDEMCLGTLTVSYASGEAVSPF